MDLVLEKVANAIVIELPVEELDAGNAAELKRELQPVLEQNARIVFDLRRLRFIDSSGLGVFLSALRRASAKGGDVKLCCMSKQVRTVFELVRLHRILEIHDTRDAALAAFSTPLLEKSARQTA